jgi:hypothetical protein
MGVIYSTLCLNIIFQNMLERWKISWEESILRLGLDARMILNRV